MTKKQYMDIAIKDLVDMFDDVSPEKKVNMIRNILDTDGYSPEEILMKAKIWISIVTHNYKLTKVNDANATQESVKISPVRKHNTIPFDKKMEMINYYNNNRNVTYRDVSDVFDVPYGTAQGLIYRYNKRKKSLDERNLVAK